MRLKDKQLKLKYRNHGPAACMSHKEQIDQARYYGEKTWRKWRHIKNKEYFDGSICPGNGSTEFSGDAMAHAHEEMMQACHDRWAKIYPEQAAEQAARWAANQ